MADYVEMQETAARTTEIEDEDTDWDDSDWDEDYGDYDEPQAVGVDADFEITDEEASEDDVDFAFEDDEEDTDYDEDEEESDDIASGDLGMEKKFFEAVKRSKFSVVQDMVNKRPKLCFATDKIGRTPLYFAISSGSLKILRHIIDAGKANVRHKNNAGATPLHIAAYLGGPNGLKAVKVLLNSGASKSVNDRDNDGRTALHHAADQDEDDICKLLLAKGARVRSRDLDGNTAVHLAAKKESEDCVTVLLDHDLKGKKAKIDKKELANKHHQSPLHFAAAQGCAKITLLLLQRGFSADFQDKIPDMHRTPVHYCVENTVATQDVAKYKMTLEHLLGLSKEGKVAGTPPDVNKLDDKKELTPLHVVATTNNVELADILVNRAKANPGLKDSKANSAVHLAIAEEQSHSRKTEMVTLLVNKLQYLSDDKGLSVLNARNKLGSRCIHLAAHIGNADIIELLMDKDVAMNVIDFKGRNPFHEACRGGNLAAFEMLVGNYDLEEGDYSGRLGLHYAAQGGHDTICTYLVDYYGASPDVKDNNGDTPLLLASQKKKSKVADFLINCDANPMAVNFKDVTPLQAMARNDMGPSFEISVKKSKVHPFAMVNDTPLLLAMGDVDSHYHDTLLDRFKRQTDTRDDADVNLYDFGIDDKGYDFMINGKGSLSLLNILNSGNAQVLTNPAMLALSSTLWQRYARFWVWWHAMNYWVLIAGFTFLSLSTAFDSDSDLLFHAQRGVAILCMVMVLYHLYLEAMEFKRTFYSESVLNPLANNALYDWLADCNCLFKFILSIVLPRKLPSYVTDWWNYYDLTTYMMVLVCMPVVFFPGTIPKERNLLAICVLMLWTKSLQEAAAFRPTSTLVRIIGGMIYSVAQIIIVALIFMFGFGQGFYLMLHGEPGFTDFTSTSVTLFRTFLGDFEWDTVLESESNLVLILFLAYIVVSTVLLLNLLVAMMTTSYEDIRESAEREFEKERCRAIWKVLPQVSDSVEETLSDLKNSKEESTTTCKEERLGWCVGVPATRGSTTQALADGESDDGANKSPKKDEPKKKGGKQKKDEAPRKLGDLSVLLRKIMFNGNATYPKGVSAAKWCVEYEVAKGSRSQAGQAEAKNDLEKMRSEMHDRHNDLLEQVQDQSEEFESIKSTIAAMSSSLDEQLKTLLAGMNKKAQMKAEAAQKKKK